MQGESLGPAVRLNPGYENYWAYVTHFAHAPFYVYAYAFGDLLVSALMEKRRERPRRLRAPVRTTPRRGGIENLRRSARPLRPRPARQALLGGGRRTPRTTGGRV